MDTAHESGYKVSVHIGHERNLQWAIDAGVDDIAHMVVDPISKETAEQIVQKGIYWVPTLELWNGVSKDYGLDDTLGTIETGKLADMLIVNGDPLTENLPLTIRMVIHGGKIVVDNHDVPPSEMALD